ncbi:MAG: DNA gyrase subunit A [Deltaproteobacteria bacterium]|nr:DNA gyrase subunit A [Deltaproteobacteria bacterium]
MAEDSHEASGGGDQTAPPGAGGPAVEVSQVHIEEEMRSAYLDYAMSVIIGRAIPDVRDGLKPVHRRILYAMHEGKLAHNQAYRKSARVVGDVIGKYHPHGDSAVYDALVRMAQEFSLRSLLVDGQGNFGSLDGDPPAAMRYTEVRLRKLTGEMLADLDKETVEWGPNYDESLLEPLVMPTKFPNLLANGGGGIAVGMATNLAPHNLGEVVDATIALIENPAITLSELMQIVPGPDFPTGGIILGVEPIRQAYETGRGVLMVRARTTIEVDEKKRRETIIVTEVPYQTNKARILEKIADLVREKKIAGISDIRDESNREGVRIVVDLKRDVMGQIVLNQLYKMTPLQTSFGIINLAIAGGRPRVLGLKPILEHFVAFRREVVTKRSRFELRKAEERLHVLGGLKIAIDNIDEVVEIIRKAMNPAQAAERLMKRFELSEAQTRAILDMRLARLTGLERDKILSEIAELERRVAEFMAILSDRARLLSVILEELKEIRESYADERRTEISPREGELIEEDLIAEEDMVVAVSHLGYIKRNPVTLYRAQGRGGIGIAAMDTREDDFVHRIYVASTHSSLLFFSDRGKVYHKRVYEIPRASRTARGKAIVNFVGMEPGERVAAIVPVTAFEEGRFIVTATVSGYVKKSDLMLYSSIRQTGIIGVVLEEGDRLVGAEITDGSQDIFLSTKGGFCIRFSEDQVRTVGRAARGVTGVNLREGDGVVSMTTLHGETVNGETTLLTVCENGYGKRTDLGEYRGQNRGGKGIIAIKATERNGPVVGSFVVSADDDVMVVTDAGTMIRFPSATVSHVGRNTMGVRLMKLRKEQRVVSVERLAVEEMDQPAEVPAEESDGEPAEEPTEEPAEEPAEQPAEEPQEEASGTEDGGGDVEDEDGGWGRAFAGGDGDDED